MSLLMGDSNRSKTKNKIFRISLLSKGFWAFKHSLEKKVCMCVFVLMYEYNSSSTISGARPNRLEWFKKYSIYIDWETYWLVFSKTSPAVSEICSKKCRKWEFGFCENGASDLTDKNAFDLYWRRGLLVACFLAKTGPPIW